MILDGPATAWPLRALRLVLCCTCGALISRGEPDQRGWQVRRMRTVDALKSGGFPEWNVVVTATGDAVTATITEDRPGARGVIHIGRRIIPKPDSHVVLTCRYTCFCDLEHRSSNLQICVFRPAIWDRLGQEPRTPKIDGEDASLRPMWSASVHHMTEPDVAAATPLPETTLASLAMFLRAHAGQEVVVALSWMGAHQSLEGATVTELKLEEINVPTPEERIWSMLDLDLPALAPIKRAVAGGDPKLAASLLLEHFRTRYAAPEPAALARGTKQDADMALEDRFRSIGSPKFFKLRDEFDWDRNAIDDKEWLLHLQWHHILRTMLQAGVIYNDSRYTEKAIQLIRDWIPRNHPGAPWSWRTLEVSLRSLVWTEIHPYLVQTPAFTPEDNVQFLVTLGDHLDFLLPASRFHSGHNFGATESKALLTAGMHLHEFANSQQWKATARQRFEGEIDVQFLEDGAQRELTCGYHNSVTNTFFSVSQMLKDTDTPPSEAFMDRLEKMHEYTLFLTKPDGSQPNVGDTWGSNQASLVERGGHYFNRPDMLYVSSGGKTGERPAYLDTQLQHTGYYVMRTAWTDDPQGIYVFFDAARVWGGRHQHYDALGIILYAYGRTLTPDAGPFSYGSPLRPVFKSTAAHSTVCVDDTDQNTSACTLHRIHTGRKFSFAAASQQGYPSITHRRQVFFARPDGDIPPYIIVIDRIDGDDSPHIVDQNFHLFTERTTTDPERLSVRTQAKEGGNLRITSLATDGVTMMHPTSWLMTSYGNKRDRASVRFRRDGPLPAIFATLLIPLRQGPEPELEAKLVASADGKAPIQIDVTHVGGHDRVVIGPTVSLERRAADGTVQALEIADSATRAD